MRIITAITALLFPPKCHFCRALLSKNETDICHRCRSDAPVFLWSKRKIPLIAQWTAVWYYKDKVRASLHRFKFGNARGYAPFYGRALAMKLQEVPFGSSFDVLSWVPVSRIRRFFRGYDQSELLAIALGKELGIPAVRTLNKKRHTRPQSSIRDAARRRANILNAFCAENAEQFAGKRVLLVDDVVTTGVTASECAKTLLLNGAKEVDLIAVATAAHD